MKKLLVIVGSLFISGSVFSDTLRTVFNPFTGKPDYINVVSTSASGGSTNGSINAANQYSSAYYSASGSTNVISGLAPGTSGQVLTTAGPSLPPFWSSASGTVVLPSSAIAFGSPINTVTGNVTNLSWDNTANNMNISGTEVVGSPSSTSGPTGGFTGYITVNSSGSSKAIEVNVNGSVGGGAQTQQGAITVRDDLNAALSLPTSLVVIVDSSTDLQQGYGMLEIWSNNPLHNDPMFWQHRVANNSSPEYRVDSPSPNMEQVATSTDNAHGRGKFEPYATPFQSEILQYNSRAWDNLTFENMAYYEPLDIQPTIATPGLYLRAQDLTDDSGVLTSSNTSGVNFFTQNGHTVGLTGPINVASGSWRYRLPPVSNGAGQVLYQDPVDVFGDRPWNYTTGGVSGQFLQFTSTFSAPVWATVSSSSGSATPAGSNGQIQYNNAGAFGGAAGTFVTASSVTFPLSVFTSSVAVYHTSPNPNPLNQQGILDVFEGGSFLGEALFSVGSNQAGNQFTIFDRQAPTFAFGILSGGLHIGDPNFGSQVIESNQAQNEITLWNSSDGNMIFDNSASDYLWRSGGTNNYMRLSSTGTLSVQNEIRALGIITIPALRNTVLAVNSAGVVVSTTITSSGGGSGASTLQVSTSGVQITSPTASINFYGNDFIGGAIGSTATISLNPATTDFIQNTGTLQSGSTFYVSSGTVNGTVTAGAFTLRSGIGNNTGVVFQNGQNFTTSSAFLWNGTTMTATNVSGTTVTATGFLQAQGANGAAVKFGLSAGSVTITGLTSGQCLQTGTNGIVTGTGSACGAGGGTNSAVITVATGTSGGYTTGFSTSIAALDFESTVFNGSLIGANTVYVTLNKFQPTINTFGSSVTINNTLLVTDQAGNQIVKVDTTSANLTDYELSVSSQNGTRFFGVQNNSNTTAIGLLTAQTPVGASSSTYELLVSSQNGTVLFGIRANGHIVSSGTTPSLTSCGTSPVINGTDESGTVTGGTGANACTITFGAQHTNPPHCVISMQNGGLGLPTYTETATALTITQVGFGGNKMDYICGTGP